MTTGRVTLGLAVPGAAAAAPGAAVADHSIVSAGPVSMTARRGAPTAYPGDMGRTILAILGTILAIWLVFIAIGWIFAMLKTFLIIGLIAAAVFIVVSLLSKRPRRS